MKLRKRIIKKKSFFLFKKGINKKIVLSISFFVVLVILIIRIWVFNCSSTEISSRIHKKREQRTHSTKIDTSKIVFEPVMIFIPAGEFDMGSNKNDDEKPIHKVRIDSFYIGRYEITQEEWKAVMKNNPSKFKGKNLPVDQVSWNDAQEYLNKLSQITGKRYRLPTEAEWEYACRAGSKTEYCFGNNKSELLKYAWYDKNAGNQTHQVGMKKPNAWGLYDMHGNVFEWCQDWYSFSYHNDSLAANHQNPFFNGDRVVRGGSWVYNAEVVRSASRLSYDPDSRYCSVGFRCIREP